MGEKLDMYKFILSIWHLSEKPDFFLARAFFMTDTVYSMEDAESKDDLAI